MGTRPVSELVKNTMFSKWDQVDEKDLVVGLGVEKVGNPPHVPLGIPEYPTRDP